MGENGEATKDSHRLRVLIGAERQRMPEINSGSTSDVAAVKES